MSVNSSPTTSSASLDPVFSDNPVEVEITKETSNNAHTWGLFKVIEEVSQLFLILIGQIQYMGPCMS